MSKSEFNLAHSSHEKHLHLLRELRLHDCLVDVSDNVVECERLAGLDGQRLFKSLSETISRQSRVNCLNVLGGRAACDLVDLLHRDGLIGK